MRTYVREADGAVPLHRFLDYIQTGVVPAGQLEAQRPVGRDDGVADELETQRVVVSVAVEHNDKLCTCVLFCFCFCITLRNSSTTCSGLSPKKM